MIDCSPTVPTVTVELPTSTVLVLTARPSTWPADTVTFPRSVEVTLICLSPTCPCCNADIPKLAGNDIDRLAADLADGLADVACRDGRQVRGAFRRAKRHVDRGCGPIGSRPYAGLSRGARIGHGFVIGLCRNREQGKRPYRYKERDRTHCIPPDARSLRTVYLRTTCPQSTSRATRKPKPEPAVVANMGRRVATLSNPGKPAQDPPLITHVRQEGSR